MRGRVAFGGIGRQLGSAVESEINAHRLKLCSNYTVSGDKRNNSMKKNSFSLICRVLMSNVLQTLAPTIFRCLVIMKTTFS